MGSAGYLKNEVADWIRFKSRCSFSVLFSDMPQVMKNKVIVKKWKKPINCGSCEFKTLEDLSCNLINQDILPKFSLLPPFPSAQLLPKLSWGMCMLCTQVFALFGQFPFSWLTVPFNFGKSELTLSWSGYSTSNFLQNLKKKKEKKILGTVLGFHKVQE